MGWVAVDFDGVLAEEDPQVFPAHGAPIYRMIDRVVNWLAEGKDVRIFTARASLKDVTSRHEMLEPVRNFCYQFFGQVLPITCEKDYLMVEMWDDRAVQVIPNTGIAVRDLLSNQGEFG